MNRSLLLLLLAACSGDDTPLPTMPGGGPHRPPVDSPRDPVEPDACIAVEDAALRFSTTGHDELRDVAVAPDGSLLVVGQTHGTRGVVLVYGPDLSYVNQLATMQTPGTDAFDRIAIEPATRDVWLAARTDGELSGMPARGGVDVVIGRLAADGFRRQQRGFYAGDETPAALAVGHGVLAAAGFEATDSSDVDPFLAVYTIVDGDTRPHWYSRRPLPAVERHRAAAITPEHVIVAGDIADGDDAGTYVVARTHDGGVAWHRPLSALPGDRIAAVQILPDGDVMWAGTTTGRLGRDAFGGTDIVVGRIDGATGAARWTVQHGTIGDEQAIDLAIDPRGRIVVAGTVGDLDRDVMLLALDPLGAPLGEEHWRSDGNDVATGLALDACGTAAIAGYTDGDLGGPGAGGRDGFVLVTRPIRD